LILLNIDIIVVKLSFFMPGTICCNPSSPRRVERVRCNLLDGFFGLIYACASLAISDRKGRVTLFS
jgi:hypothetical protein